MSRLFSSHTSLSAQSLNALEDKLCSLPAKRPYQRYGPFVNGAGPGITAEFLNGIEDFLASLDASERTEVELPASLVEQPQYEHPLVEYDYGL